MKKLVAFTASLALAAALAACEQTPPTPAPTETGEPVSSDKVDECPRADGAPCR
jgi:hypothetical protein